ncbi:type II toxin-antitoxin system VapC family toxin [Rothia terrae]|jgi:predicted nucleic acid-binding protein|nr:type II toxin-antitoxin system VapC family toxin [Rothia terrae]MDT0189931.1 type II toxin-antitoxin system VapC family toxin [Rothia terrae]
MYVLDTNVVSEIRKPASKIDANVKAWIENHYLSDLYITALTVFEVEIGVRRMLRKDQRQGQKLEKWYRHQLLPMFDGRILPLDSRSAQVSAAFQVPDPRPERDCFIAAIAVNHRMKLVTRNEKDFHAIDVSLINPWKISDA